MQKKNNYQKYNEIQILSPYFPPKEISETTGISLNSVYHYQKKYCLPTYKQTERQLLDIALMMNIEGKEKALRELQQMQNA
tara:strand:+ start:224 stop:466 length:243 start_codon:yes stop_codon:yes gene_type:complete